MSALPPASYNFLYADAHQSIMKFLGNRDLLINYAPVSRGHEGRVTLYHKATLTTVEIVSGIANCLFADILKFPKLTDLELRGCEFRPLALPHGAGSVDHLSFVGCWSITSRQILMFLEAVSSIRGLSLSVTSEQLFKPIEWERLSAAAKNNLKQLTQLNLSDSNIHWQGLLEILQNSTNFKSVDLSRLPLSNAIFRELVRSKGLTHLNLNSARGDDLDYGIFGSCTSLESFKPSVHISEEALIAIIQSNPNLTHLDLYYCSSEVLTDRVLQAIAKSLPRLKKLEIGPEHNITDIGFHSLIRGCKEISSLQFVKFVQLSAATLNELKNYRALRELELNNYQELIEHGIEWSDLPDEFFDALAFMTDLTSLNLSCNRGSQSEIHSKIQNLINLRSLELFDSAGINDGAIKGILDHCPKLHTLTIFGCDSPLSTLDVIRTALREGRTELRHLYISRKFSAEKEEVAINMNMQLMAEFPQLVYCGLDI